jgi:hypothetical protein
VLGLIGLEGPGESEGGDVLGGDLGELAVAAAGVVTVVLGPTVGGWVEELGVGEALTDLGATLGAKRKGAEQGESTDGNKQDGSERLDHRNETSKKMADS